MANIYRNNRLVSSTNNLRNLTRYAREVAPVRNVRIFRDASLGRAHVTLNYTDGAEGVATFASPRVARSWAMARCAHNPNFQCWKPEDITVHEDGDYHATPLTPIG